MKIVNYYIKTHNIDYLKSILNDYEIEYIDCTEALEDLLTTIENSNSKILKKFKSENLIKAEQFWDKGLNNSYEIYD